MSNDCLIQEEPISVNYELQGGAETDLTTWNDSPKGEHLKNVEIDS